MSEYNYKHINIICPECKNSDILKDDFHEETYCTRCGLVIQDNTIFKVTIAIEDDKIEEKRIRKLWLRKREKKASLKKY